MLNSSFLIQNRRRFSVGNVKLNMWPLVNKDSTPLLWRLCSHWEFYFFATVLATFSFYRIHIVTYSAFCLLLPIVQHWKGGHTMISMVELAVKVSLFSSLVKVVCTVGDVDQIKHWAIRLVQSIFCVNFKIVKITAFHLKLWSQIRLESNLWVKGLHFRQLVTVVMPDRCMIGPMRCFRSTLVRFLYITVIQVSHTTVQVHMSEHKILYRTWDQMCCSSNCRKKALLLSLSYLFDTFLKIFMNLFC